MWERILGGELAEGEAIRQKCLLKSRMFREEVISELRTIEQEVNDLTQQLFATLEQRGKLVGRKIFVLHKFHIGLAQSRRVYRGVIEQQQLVKQQGV